MFQWKQEPDVNAQLAAQPDVPVVVLTAPQILAIARAIADPNRFALLQRIAQGEARCADLRTCLAISAPTLSHHMKELDSAGLITTTRVGKFVSATLNRETWNAYLAHLQSL